MKDCLFLFQVEGGESGDRSFNVFHKCVSELGFQKTAVGNNMTATLKNDTTERVVYTYIYVQYALIQYLCDRFLTY